MTERLLRFFSASPRCLRMQTLDVEEIAQMMAPVDEAAMDLPRDFARTVRDILEREDRFATGSFPAVGGTPAR